MLASSSLQRFLAGTTYKHLNTLKKTVYSLQQNVLASESELFIFSDAAKTNKDMFSVDEVRSYLKTISGFKNIQVFEAKENKGLANSIIEGAERNVLFPPISELLTSRS